MPPDEQLHISCLPTEVLEQIFECLLDNLDDLLAVSTVCSSWYLTASRFIGSRSLLCLQHDLIHRTKTLNKSHREHKHWAIQDSDIHVDGNFGEFWQSVCEEVESLTINNCYLREPDFVSLLSSCKNIKALKLQQLEHTFMTVNLLQSELDRKRVREGLQALESLEVRCERYISDNLLHHLMAVTPPLTSLSLATCNISYQDAIRNRFYPVGVSSPSEFVSTFAKVLEWIQGMTATLRKLDLSGTRIDSGAMERLMLVPQLQLHTLSLANCDQVTNTAVERLCSGQPWLRRLDLTGCYRVSGVAVVALADSLPCLQWLSLHGCGAVTAESVSRLVQSHELHHLDVGATDSSSSCAVQHKMHRFQPKLRYLSLAGVSLDAPQVVLVAAGAPNLTHLDLSMSAHSLKNVTLQLRVLLLSTCCLLTDAGFMGECYRDASLSHHPAACDDCKASVAPKKTLSGVNLTTSPRRVQLYSRRVTCSGHRACRCFYDYDSWTSLVDSLSRVDAEVSEELQEANEAGESQQVNGVEQQESLVDYKAPLSLRRPASIANLRGLRRLSLCGVFKLTDHCLVTAFHFPELQHLNLAQCGQISSVGLGAMASRCRALKELLLSRCDSVDDIAVQAVVHHLHRLQRLHLQHCTLLTSDSLDSLHWRASLRYLDISQCTGMTQSSVDEFSLQCPNVKVITLNTKYMQSIAHPLIPARTASPISEQFSTPQVSPPPPQPPPLPLMAKVKNVIFRPWMR
ncbi:F-box/LRR-repeat protein 3 isoform X1 [Hyalella azteca]|uniref:F-box/LRR-repeat protein 3 isoform X1 n=1 Tax=Hyalella azteca TaxID=294128 RepID=A0A8B7NXU0_HYAAZ|nr:F-box/LRR-repeat protein 3 isoform X2 [Hyalella azteca]XP_047736323.1 F-box/LRR-repeat protein 3 isoform X1 [Hyalella azteca]